MNTATQPVLEIRARGAWERVTEDIFRSWAGARRKDGVAFHGPVYNFLSDELASPTQARTCGCPKCWAR